jgi:hypothetical protein
MEVKGVPLIHPAEGKVSSSLAFFGDVGALGGRSDLIPSCRAQVFPSTANKSAANFG